MEPITEVEEERTPASAQPPGDTSVNKPSPGAEGGDESSALHPAAAVGDDKSTPAVSADGNTTAETETPKPQESEPKRSRDVDPTIELGEAFEGFTSLPKTKKGPKKKKTPRLASKKQAATAGPSGGAAAVKMRLTTAPVPSADQAKRKAKAGIPTGLSKRPIRSAFGGRAGDLASVVDMPVPMLTDDEIGAGTFFGPSGAGSSGADLGLSDGEDGDGAFGRLFGDAEQYAAEFEDSLNFYSETHEEQDPVYAAFASAKATERREAALARLDAEEAEERKKYEEMVLQKAQRARAEIKAKVEAVRLHTATKQQKQREEAQAQFQEKRRHNEARVMQGQQIVVEKRQKDYKKAQVGMQQLYNEGNISRDDLSRKWGVIQQQLAANASRLQAELEAKAEEIRKKTDDQFALQKAQFQDHHKKRMKEMEVTIRRFVEKFKVQEEQTRRRHSRRFEERIKRKRESVLRRFPPPKLPSAASEESSPRSPSKDAVAARENTSPASRSNSSTPTKKHHHRHGSSSSEKREHHHSHHHHHHHHHNSRSQDTTNQAYQSSFHDDGGDSVLRQKRRKGALGMQSIVLQVEVHNEGIVLMPRTANSSSDSKSKDETSEAETEAKKYHTFFPWGLRARQILHSVLCGEVPEGFGWDAIPYNGSLQAGQVRCMVTDMRTSEELASIMRTKAAKEQEGLQAKRRVAELQEMTQEAQNAVSNAREEVEIAAHERSECVAKLRKEEKSKKEANEQLSIFKEKASGYFNADGSLNNVTPQDYRERLLAMLDKYRETLDAHNRSVAELEEMVRETKAAESALKKALSQAKKKAESADHSLQKAIKKVEAERDSTPSQKSLSSPKAASTVAEDEEEGIAKARIGGVLDILRLTADKRRSHLELRRHNNYRIAWKDDEVDAEDWPDSLKRSLVMKMQRRRVQITLRPSRTSILSDAKAEVKKWNQDQGADAKTGTRTPLEQAIRAEQLLLLSLHPAEDSPRFPPAPQTSSSSERWAEPGWQLALDVPAKEPTTAGVLPSSMAARHDDSLLETLLPECLSAPGRQTALMMRQSQLRLLCNPLSDLSRASAPAETHPAGLSSSTVIAHNKRCLELDPMNVSEEEVLKGYNFVAKTRKASSASSRKRASNRGASKERKQGSGTAKRRRTSKATSSKKNKDAGPNSSGAPSSASKKTGTNAAPVEKSRASSSARNEDKLPTSNARPEPAIPREQRNRHSNIPMRQDSLSQPPVPMQNFSPTRSQQAAVPNQNPRSLVAYSNSTSTSSPGHQRARYQGGEVRTGNVATFNDAQMVIPQPPPPPQQRAQQNAYQQHQQQQQAFYQQQQQQQQQMYFAAQQQQAAVSQQMQSPMQVPYQAMRMQGQPTQEYPGRAAPIHQMQGRSGAVSGGSGPSQPPPPIMTQGRGPNGMPPPGAVSGQGRGLTNPSDSLFQLYGNNNEQKR